MQQPHDPETHEGGKYQHRDHRYQSLSFSLSRRVTINKKAAKDG
jgi:hypothetical protein